LEDPLKNGNNKINIVKPVLENKNKEQDYRDEGDDLMVMSISSLEL
jgi:hypothetical protein